MIMYVSFVGMCCNNILKRSSEEFFAHFLPDLVSLFGRDLAR